MSATAVSFVVQDSQNFIHEVVQDFNLQIQTVLVKDIDGIYRNSYCPVHEVTKTDKMLPVT